MWLLPFITRVRTEVVGCTESDALVLWAADVRSCVSASAVNTAMYPNPYFARNYSELKCTVYSVAAIYITVARCKRSFGEQFAVFTALIETVWELLGV